MGLLDAAIGALVPWTGARARLLREQLSRHSVTVPLSAACIEEFARDAHEAVARTRTSGESYLECLRRQLDARASFLKRWTTTDEKLDGDEWEHLVALARKYALPRPWRIPEPTATEYRPPKVEIPQQLMAPGGAPPSPSRSLGVPVEPPGAAILADMRLRRAQTSEISGVDPEERAHEPVPAFLRDASGKS